MLLVGTNIANILMDDRGRWERMKGLLREARIKYQRLKKKILDRLNSTGLRILRRSKKIKPMPERIHPDDVNYDLNVDELPLETSLSANSVVDDNDEYEYDDLDSSDDNDPFEQLKDIRNICHQIDWNMPDNYSNVFILTSYLRSNETVCSLSDVDVDLEYHHVCEYGQCSHSLEADRLASSLSAGFLFR